MIEQTSEMPMASKKLPPSSELGFGRIFTNHWFSSHYSAGKGWYKSAVEPYGNISMNPAASVLHYGQALFEGMKAFRQTDDSIVLFRPEFNYNRMVNGAERLCLEAPPKALFMQGLKDLLTLEADWVPKDPSASLYIRPTLIGTEPFLGVRPSREILFYIILSPVGSYYQNTSGTVRIWVEDQAVRAIPGGLGAVKAGANYAASLQAALLTKSKGYDQVMWLNADHDEIEEVGTMNVFFVFKDEIVTPALNGAVLPGCVRDSVLQLLRHQGKKVVERSINMTELIERHTRGDLLEAFGTGTAAVISPIGDLNFKGKPYILNDGKVGPVAEKIFKIISGIQRGLIPDPFGWITRLENL